MNKKKKYIGIVSVFGIILCGIFFTSNENIPSLDSDFIIKFFIGTINFFISVENFSKTLSNKEFKYKEIMQYLMAVVVVWRLLCEKIIYGSQFEKAHMHTFFLFINAIVFLFLYMYAKQYNIKSLIFNCKFKLNKKFFLYEVIILTIPLYLFKNSWINTQWIVAVLGLYLFIKYNHTKLTKYEKILYIIIIITMGYILLNYNLNKENGLLWSQYKRILYTYFFLLVFMQLKISKILFEKIIVVGAISSLIPFVASILMWINRGYEFHRIAPDISTIWGAMVALLITFFIFCYFFMEKKEIFITIVLLLFSLILTGSRGPILACFLVISLMAIFKFFLDKKSRLEIVAKFLAITTLAFTFVATNKNARNRFLSVNKEPSAISRIYLFEESFEQIEIKPLLGNGYFTLIKIADNLEEKINNSEDEFEKRVRRIAYDPRNSHSHNNVLEIIRATGGIGLIIYLLLHGYLMYIYIYYFLKKKDAIYLLPVFSFIVLEIIGLMDFTAVHTKYQMLLYFLCGILFEKIRKNPIKKIK